MSGAPPAMIELIVRYFGQGAWPDYSRTPAIIERDPYRRVRARLAERWRLEDLTDHNDDLGNEWWLQGDDGEWGVRLSFVGPYAIIVDSSGHAVEPLPVVEILDDAGFQLLGEELLSSPVTIWSPEWEAPLWELLFEFDNGLPWTGCVVDHDRSGE